MKKYKKQIIILSAVLVVLGIVMAVLLITAPKEEATSSNSAVEQINLITKSDVTVTSLSIKNSLSDYTINFIEEENDDGSITTRYEVPGYEDINFTTSNFDAAAKIMLNFNVDKELGEIENLEEFGLTSELGSTVTATYSDGSKETVIVGKAASESSGKYILYNGKVYITLLNLIFSADMATQVSIPSWDISAYIESDGTESYTFDHVYLKGRNFKREIRLDYNKNTFSYDMTAPIICSGGYSFSSDLADSLINFTAGSVVKVHPTEAEIEEYGLNDCYAELDFSLNGVAHKITLGNKIDNTKRYAFIDGNTSVVYGTYVTHTNTWAESKELDYRDTYASIVYIYDVDKFTVEAGGKTVEVDMKRTINTDRTTDTTKSYDYTCIVNGKEMPYADTTKFYSTVIGIPLLNMTDADGDGKTLLKITYEFYEDEKKEDLVIEYQKCISNSDRAAVYLNGDYNVSVRMNAVQDVIKAVEEFYNSAK
ncbi:MAG: hypothetical protein E7564_03125 [Ruminococcaceae bacterium]|nr:hypothetical protein [Oscillospiraceae bacterium]